ncbi:MOSC domain-containing protein [Angustibacter sp. McL0619]|uniref:MOSC domain-containing protein n=1 Tax=Angustibacter sp. McL0619 TaxID=3415676 RepID=UPI003CE91539
MALVEAVCVVHEVHHDEGGDVGETAIDKRPVPGRVPVLQLGLHGDKQLDLEHHGGRDQAVYVYAGEDASWWAGQLERDVPAGLFGENLRTTGLDVTGALIGERWRIGEADEGAVLEVTAPRIPCATFQRWLDEPQWVKRFTEHGAPGAYLRVLREGSVAAGDRIEVEHRPQHGVRITDCFPRLSPEHAQRLLDSEDAGEVQLHADLRRRSELAAARAASV